MIGGSCMVGLGKGLCWCCRGVLFSRGTVVRFCFSSELEVLEMSLPGRQKEKRILLSPD